MPSPLQIPGGPEVIIIAGLLLIPLALLYAIYKIVQRAVRKS